MANYTVRRGDTLSDIARRAGMSVQSLIAQNPQFRNPNLIRPGETVSVSGRESPASQQQAAANLMMASPLIGVPGGSQTDVNPAFASYYNAQGQLIADASGQGIGGLPAAPQIAPAGPAAPAVAGQDPDFAAVIARQQTEQEAFAARVTPRAGVTPALSPQEQRLTGMQSLLEPSIPSLSRNQQQAQAQATAQQAPAQQQVAQYNTQAIQAGIALDPENMARRAAISALGRSAPTAGETFEGLFGGVMTYLADLESKAERERVAELRTQGLSNDEARAQAQREFRPTGRANLEQYNEARGGAYYSKGTAPVTLPASADGTQAPSPQNTMQTVTQAVVLQQRQEDNAASRIALSFVDETAASLQPERILMAFGEEGRPNESMERIHQLAVSKLEQQYMQMSGGVLTPTQQATLMALYSMTTEDFFDRMGYGPSTSNPNIWVRSGGQEITNRTADEVAASIMSGGGGFTGSFYDASRVPSPGRGSVGTGVSNRAANWATQAAGLYLWRISA